MLEYEKKYLEQGIHCIAGIDEVGRGPLAGPVCAAAVILPEGLVIDGINDSKKLTEKKREALYDVIKKEALAWATAYVEPEEIDAINIRQATHKAMQMAVDALELTPEILLVDGSDRIPFSIASEYIIKGDAKSQSIAAASIMAKVTRDRFMVAMEETYPGYGFAKNKGYGTKVHMEGIRSIGLCPLHRRSFITAKVLGQYE